MLFCQTANLTASNVLACLLLAIVVQASSVYGQDPSAASSASPPFPEVLEFTSSNPLISDAGHGSLTWKEVPGAATYIVRSASESNLIYYSGAQNIAFVSGLPDGDYKFSVEALDADSNLLARSTQASVIEVKHLSLGLTWLLFSVGLVVVVAMLWIIVYGTLLSRRSTPLASPATSVNATPATSGGQNGN